MTRPESDSSTTKSYRNRLLVGMIIDMRKQAGLSQAELAEGAESTQSIIAKIEVLERRVDVDVLKRICRACGVDPAAFLAENLRREEANEPPPDYWWFTNDGQRRRRSD